MTELATVPQESSGIPPLTRGWRMRMAMEQAGKSRDEMAAVLGVSRATVTRWMHDIGRQPRYPDMEAWARTCRVPVEWLAPRNADEILDQPMHPKFPRKLSTFTGDPARSEARRLLRAVPPLDLSPR